MDRKLKHLEFIQGVINRLSTNNTGQRPNLGK